ncbi:helix-turn-helix domain-containing protein [Deinococcus multiflagellatus]|uniref:Multiprotein-bridging factor 1 family protein n=1 Tax=Deinococcus multiflagellatus TaxID=1656887 RepID=A0ABW1ZEN2_9DEIO|nr:helix-turn-helix transcriptional regulator [Deinococcus multiflagellatus]MBZ9712228.1 helix-turn-helix domain-containing protein [Deinococcus multiflagellatus]
MPETPSTLRELRERTVNPETGKAFTGEEIARKLSVSTNTYFRWEWGQSVPNGINLMRLEKILPGSTHTLVDVEAQSA